MYNTRSKVNRELKKRWEMKYITSVYQGETDRAQRKQDAPTYASGAFLPSGSICMIDNDNVAKLYVATDNPVPHFVFKGNNEVGVRSEVGNIAGGIMTTIPCTGNYRVQTCVFAQGEGIVYNVNDFVTVAEKDADTMGPIITEGDNKTKVTTTMFTKDGAVPYTSVIAGVVCKPVYRDQMGNNTLIVDLMFLPKQA